MLIKQNTRYLWHLLALRDKARAHGDTAICKALDRLIQGKKKPVGLARAVEERSNENGKCLGVNYD